MPARPALPPALDEEARAAMRSPGRAYHDEAHLDEVLERFDEVAAEVGWSRPAEVLVALLFHDAVYRPGATDNEARSAALARSALGRHVPHGAVDVERVAALIELTARHALLSPADVDAEAALFLDCDMAILGAEPARYQAYERGVAMEYQAVPADLFRAGRQAFLERLLAAPRIFLSPHFHARLDAAARANLAAALASPSPTPG